MMEDIDILLTLRPVGNLFENAMTATLIKMETDLQRQMPMQRR